MNNAVIGMRALASTAVNAHLTTDTFLGAHRDVCVCKWQRDPSHPPPPAEMLSWRACAPQSKHLCLWIVAQVLVAWGKVGGFVGTEPHTRPLAVDM